MGFFNKLFGKKEKETLDQGLQKTKEGFLAKDNQRLLPEKARLMKKCWITWKKHWLALMLVLKQR